MASEALKHMAKRVESDEFFAAKQLAAYRDARGWTDEWLSKFLGIDADALIRLKLCGRLRLPDVAAVAGDFGCNEIALADIVEPDSP